MAFNNFCIEDFQCYWMGDLSYFLVSVALIVLKRVEVFIFYFDINKTKAGVDSEPDCLNLKELKWEMVFYL